jgi:Cupin-like domain
VRSAPWLRDLVDASTRAVRRLSRRPPPEPIAVARIAPPSVDDFRRVYQEAGVPVVIEGLTERWNARRWTLDSLAAEFGAVEIAVAIAPGGTIVGNPRRGVPYRKMTLASFVAQLASGDRPDLYLSTSLEEYLPGLLAQLDRAPYCAEAPWRRSRLWMSAAGTASPLHRDIAHNLFVQLHGRKRFWLYSPEATPWLYSYSFASGLPNFSRYDPEAADDDAFPHARAVRPTEVHVGPGDVLYLPSMWWHHVRTLERSLSVNTWWADGGWLEAAVRAAELFKEVRRIDK